GAGTRKRSKNQATRTRASQTNMPTMNRGDHHAGTSHTKPINSMTKKRGPKAKGSSLRPRAQTATDGGVNVSGILAIQVRSLVAQAVHRRASLSEFRWWRAPARRPDR